MSTAMESGRDVVVRSEGTGQNCCRAGVGCQDTRSSSRPVWARPRVEYVEGPITPIVLQNSALPCYSTNPGGGISPLTHDDANSISPPSAFGPYRVMHQIGVGVLGPVFRTFELDGDRLVALKAFHLDLTPEHARTLADLLQSTTQAGGSHPVLVPSIDAGVSDDIPYLATE